MRRAARAFAATRGSVRAWSVGQAGLRLLASLGLEGEALSRGIENTLPCGNDLPMKPENTPPANLPHSAAAVRQLQNWQDLREQMQTLHAQLEYLRLMLRLGGSK